MSEQADPHTGLTRRSGAQGDAAKASDWRVLAFLAGGAVIAVAAVVGVGAVVFGALRHDEPPEIVATEALGDLPEVARAEIAVTRRPARRPVERTDREDAGNASESAAPPPSSQESRRITLSALRPAPRLAVRPEREARARQAQVREAQIHLAAMGYAPGLPDGRVGPITQAAIDAFAADSGQSGAQINDGFIAALRLARDLGHQAGGSGEAEAAQEDAAAPFGTLFEDPSDALTGDGEGELEPAPDEPADVGQVLDAQILLSSMGYALAEVSGYDTPETQAAARAFADERGVDYARINAAFITALREAAADDHRATRDEGAAQEDGE